VPSSAIGYTEARKLNKVKSTKKWLKTIYTLLGLAFVGIGISYLWLGTVIIPGFGTTQAVIYIIAGGAFVLVAANI
jgi:hypothetical protein